MLDRLLCCVGPIKGGTTWLMWHLRHSEELFFAPEKEIHYHYGRAFWPDGISWRLRLLQLAARVTGRTWMWPGNQISGAYRGRVTANYASRFAETTAGDDWGILDKMTEFRANMAWYRDYMADPVNQDWYERIYGGAGDKWPCDFSTTTCMVGPAGFRALKKCARDLRTIYFIRNPYDRMWSHAKSVAMNRGEWDDFTKMSPDQQAKYMRRFKLHRHSLYASRIKAMRSALGAENVLVLNYDDIEAAPERLLTTVADFLQISAVPIVEDLHVRHASSPELPYDPAAMAPFAKQFDAEIARLDALGYGAAKAWTSPVASA